MSYTNVSRRFKDLCLWAITICVVFAFGSYFVLNRMVKYIGACICCVGFFGGLAWFVSANIFVFD